MNLYQVPGSQMRPMWVPQREEEVGLHGDHEEEDTRLFLHSWCNKWRNQKVASRLSRYWCNVATDTLDCIKTSCNYVWMISGTAKNQKCYPVHSVAEKLSTADKDITLPRLPCIDRLRYYLFFQWLWQENILQSTVSCWGYWRWWRFGTCRTVRVQTVWNIGLKNCRPSQQSIVRQTQERLRNVTSYQKFPGTPCFAC